MVLTTDGWIFIMHMMNLEGIIIFKKTGTSASGGPWGCSKTGDTSFGGLLEPGRGLRCGIIR